MRELGKVVNGSLHLCSERERRVITVTNPSEEVLRLVGGYKEVVFDKEPEYNPETQEIISDIKETDNLIKIHWIIKNIEPEKKDI